ncbi:hypothetical protein BT63DRAFT_422120 [Microthyrium microscopicum]|uniref:Pyridoxamine 5'-phosphate oxidase Alr4036 family FMN-binding domain-containing protein n=1 Tax=Microthyrium microscopicum TaxID=703497 RepID=A0A6A6UL12_9PEZI|nr:hypothetical protein BT63DRAFT_422120 [Microthyrium microscopicum]
MSAQSSTQDTSTVPRAPWRDQFVEHVSKMKSPEFVLSTLGSDPTGRFKVIPRARTCIYRGMWGAMTPNDRNPAKKNPAAFESDCPTLTTDVRMEKVGEIFRPAVGTATDEDIHGCGGGGPVEALWWIKEEGIMTQWRLRGDAWIVAPNIDDKDNNKSEKTKEQIGKWTRVVDEKEVENWSWERELTAHYGNLAPGMRGSFKNPPPGKPANENSKEAEKVGEGTEDLQDSEGRKNFRVVVIRPYSVESIDLSDPSKARRQHYTYDEENSKWEHETLWP